MNASSHPPLEKALASLFARRAYGIKPGLEAEQSLLEILGHPENSFRAIHVAGTNGKGSVCAMISSVLQAAGYRVGLFTSPHLVRFNERFRVDGVPIDDEALGELIQRIEPAAERVAQAMYGRRITFFEYSTALAFQYFKDSGVQFAVIETGLGGRLDATNVLDPALAVITDIGVDHAAFLGHDLATIAGEKAGIIKPGRPTICGSLAQEARAVMERTAAKRASPVFFADEGISVQRTSNAWEGQKLRIESRRENYGTVNLPLLGKHQVLNCATACLALEVLDEFCGTGVDRTAMRRGLESVVWPARCQVLQEQPLMLLDCAHNPGGARALGEVLEELAQDMPVGLVAGFLADKDFEAILRVLAHGVRKAWIVPVNSERAVPPEKVLPLAFRLFPEAEAATLDAAWDAATGWAAKHGGLVVVAGSTYLAGEVLARTAAGPPAGRKSSK